MRLLAAALLSALAFGASHAQEPAAIRVSPVLTTTRTVTGQPVVLPGRSVEVLASLIEIAPGARLPRHRHPYPRYAYVLDGDLTVHYEGAPPQTFPAGAFIVEAVDTWHFGLNGGSIPVRLLVIDQVEAGQPATILAD